MTARVLERPAGCGPPPGCQFGSNGYPESKASPKLPYRTRVELFQTISGGCGQSELRGAAFKVVLLNRVFTRACRGRTGIKKHAV